MSKNNKTIIKIAITCIGLQEIGAGALSPAMAAITAAFPDINPSIVSWLMTVSSACMVVAAPLYAKLVTVMRKKTILYIATVLFVGCGVAPVLMNNFWLILTARILFGVGMGFVMTMAASLVVDFFDGYERQSMMGYVNAVAGIGGMMFSFLGGYFANIDWHYTFLAYGVSIFFLGFACIFMPEPPKKEEHDDIKAEGNVRYKLPASVYLFSVAIWIYAIMMNSFAGSIALMVVGEGLANTAQVGVAFMFLTLGASISAALVGKLTMVLKKYLVFSGYATMFVGFTSVFLLHNMIAITAGIFITGFGMGILNAGTFAKCASLVPNHASASAISRSVAGVGLGALCAPLFLQFVTGATASGIGRTTIGASVVGIAVASIFVFIISKIYDKPYDKSSEIPGVDN